MRLQLTSILILSAAIAAAQTPPPAVNSTGVVNTASQSSATGVAPGSLVSIFGSNLASSMAASSTVPLSTTLSGVSVTFNSTPAPVQFVSGSQINVQVPWGLALSGSAATPAQVTITRDDGVASAAVGVQVVAGAPGIYNIGGQAIAVNSDGSLAAPAGALPGIATHPAVIGDPNGLTILATGLGAVDSPLADGANSADTVRKTLATPTVMIGGVAAQVTFSGLSPQFIGVNQINVVVPAGTPTGSAVPVQIQIGGVKSNIASVAVSQ
jgi:uncharacterized protein (TIGR03437 family)